jgi:hypothetical protein
MIETEGILLATLHVLERFSSEGVKITPRGADKENNTSMPELGGFERHFRRPHLKLRSASKLQEN